MVRVRPGLPEWFAVRSPSAKTSLHVGCGKSSGIPCNIAGFCNEPSQGEAMKVRMAIAAAVLAAAVGMAVGEENPAQPAQPDPAKGKDKATQVCAACHGADGNSPIPQNPVLAGQGYDYLYKQLRNFKGEPKEQLRNNPVMSAMVATLSDEDTRNLAAYFSVQTTAPRAATSKDTIEMGQNIYRGGIPDR